MKLLLTTPHWMREVAHKEVESLLEREASEIEEGVEVSFETERELCEAVLTLMYYARTIQQVSLKERNIDLLGFSLEQRSLRQHNRDKCPSLIAQYAFRLLQIKSKEFSIINPLAKNGEMLYECYLAVNDHPLHVKQRLHIPLLKQFPKFKSSLPSQDKKKPLGKFVSVVQDNLSFKHMRENLNLLGIKMKISQYELDWLDVKFAENEIGYGITYLKEFDDDLLDHLFYQLSFVIEQKVVIVSHSSLPQKGYTKHKLNLIQEEKVGCADQEYVISVLEI